MADSPVTPSAAPSNDHASDDGGPPRRSTGPFRRYRWLILGIVVVATTAGFIISRVVKPKFEVNAMMMVGGVGAATNTTARNENDVTELLKSFRVADQVTQQLTLFLDTADGADRSLFHEFAVDDDGYLPSQYELVIDKARRRWTLTVEPAGTLVDSGGVADSLGARFGLKWQLEKGAFVGSGIRTVRFTLNTPREAAVRMRTRLSAKQKGNFLSLSLEDTDPKLAAAVVNTWANRFMTVANELKNRQVAAADSALGNRAATRTAPPPDFVILDSAIAPLEPSKNTPFRIVVLAFVGGLGCAIGSALVLNMIRGADSA